MLVFASVATGAGAGVGAAGAAGAVLCTASALSAAAAVAAAVAAAASVYQTDSELLRLRFAVCRACAPEISVRVLVWTEIRAAKYSPHVSEWSAE